MTIQLQSYKRSLLLGLPFSKTVRASNKPFTTVYFCLGHYSNEKMTANTLLSLRLRVFKEASIQSSLFKNLMWNSPLFAMNTTG